MSLLEWNYLIHRPLFEENKRSTVTEEKNNNTQMLQLPRRDCACSLYSLCGWVQLKFGVDSYVCVISFVHIWLSEACVRVQYLVLCVEYFSTWQASGQPTPGWLVLLLLEGSWFCPRSSGTCLPPPVLFHPLFSHCDDCVLVMFQPPRHCFPVSCNHLLPCNCLALRFGLAGELADCFCLAEGLSCSLLVNPVPCQ